MKTKIGKAGNCLECNTPMTILKPKVCVVCVARLLREQKAREKVLARGWVFTSDLNDNILRVFQKEKEPNSEHKSMRVKVVEE